MKRVVVALIFLVSFQAYGQEETPSLYDLMIKSKKPQVKILQTTKLNFKTHHPQGMMKIGNFFYMTSVEVLKKPEKYTAQTKPKDSTYDRDTGAGKGHLFKFDLEGNMINDIALGEGDVYHPGGFGFDGTYLWIPVAEYRPNSKSIIYKVNEKTLLAEKAFEVTDHIGGITTGYRKQILHGISWGSRNFYTWTNKGKFFEKRENPSFYVDYQDCKSIEKETMICTGLGKYDLADQKLILGGIDLISLKDLRPLRQLPIVTTVPTDESVSFTQNPTDFQATKDGKILMYSVPEDGDKSNLYVLELRQ